MPVFLVGSIFIFRLFLLTIVFSLAIAQLCPTLLVEIVVGINEAGLVLQEVSIEDLDSVLS